MTFYQQLQDSTARERDYLLSAPIIEACRTGEINKEMYIAFLRQAYYHVRHTVPLLMATGGKLHRIMSGYVAQLQNTLMKNMAIRNGY